MNRKTIARLCMARALCLPLLCCALLPGCSQPPPPAVEEEAKDYKVLVERARARSMEDRALLHLQNAITLFQRRVGRTPTNLSELVEREYMDAIPPIPDDKRYVYQPSHGHVDVADKRPKRRRPAKAFPETGLKWP